MYTFLVFYESKKYLKGTLFSLKKEYVNKQGQQDSSKILKHPDGVITRWRSYTIWRDFHYDADLDPIIQIKDQNIEKVLK